MSDPKTRFEEAIERLYTAFAGYPLDEDTGMCPCCHKPEDELRLHSTSLRDLTDDDLYSYSWSALLTWGDEEDFKHFLPRLFELTFQIPTGDLANPEVILEKLNYVEWRSWPADEITAVEGFLMVAWEYAISIEENYEIDSILCAIGQVVIDMSPFLTAWENSGITGLSHLSKFIADDYRNVAKRNELTDLFWDKRTAQMNQVIEWLEKPSTLAILENVFLENQDHPLAVNIFEGIDHLRWIETYRKNTT